MKCFVNKVTPKLFLLQVMNTVRISNKIPDKQLNNHYHILMVLFRNDLQYNHPLWNIMIGIKDINLKDNHKHSTHV